MPTLLPRLLEFRDDEPASSSGRVPSLQDAFTVYTKFRQQEPKSLSGVCATPRGQKPARHGSKASHSPSGPSPEEQRARLRALFVETARSYIGVPYARKHHDPHWCACEGCSGSGRQLYHEPLFLDCCGLVRRVCRALQRQLGFRLGSWNQAYQYDTLPKRLDSVSQLQPGDLIFYSGVYLEPGSRRHAFDMTHVEVFVGGPTGEGTIGSRERYKWVMEYDSFRFQSQRWRLRAYHFCSIDPWLDGICVPQHPGLWRPRRRTKEGAAEAEMAVATAVRQQRSMQRLVQRPHPAATELVTWSSSKYSIFGGTATTTAARCRAPVTDSGVLSDGEED